jgi:hypothetical protein
MFSSSLQHAMSPTRRQESQHDSVSQQGVHQQAPLQVEDNLLTVQPVGLTDAQLFDAYAQVFAGFSRLLLLDDRGVVLGRRARTEEAPDHIDSVTR